jgi:hypothetical protein
MIILCELPDLYGVISWPEHWGGICNTITIVFKKTLFYFNGFAMLLTMQTILSNSYIKYQMCYMAVKHYSKCMNKLNLIAVASIVAAVSFVVGMASPIAAFAQDNMTMNMDDNMSSMGNMTSGNATSMTETESLPSANETGYDGPMLPAHVIDNWKDYSIDKQKQSKNLLKIHI